MKATLILVAAMSLSGLVSARSIDELTLQIERASIAGDLDSLARYRDEIKSALSERGSPESNSYRYALGYVNWRMAYLPAMQDQKERRDELFKEAQATLEELVQDAPNDAEAHALLGSVYGGQITGMWKGMRLGPKAGRALERASTLDPDNPRIALQQGISALFTPGMFGGGADKAAAALTEARSLFASESSDKPWPNWGRTDVLAWLGQVMVKQGADEEARALYEEALSLEPDHAWIRSVLLPSLDEAGRQ